MLNISVRRALSRCDAGQSGNRRPLMVSFCIAVLMGATVTATAQQGASTGRSSKLEHSSAPVATGTSAFLPGEEASATSPYGPISLVADGETRSVLPTATAVTVGDLLAEQSLKLGPLDRCSIPLSTKLTDKTQRVQITRVRQERDVERTPLPFATKEKLSPSLRAGQKKVIQEGKQGERVKTFQCTYKDGKLIRRVKVSENVTKPQTRYVMLGTRGMSLASRGYFGGRRIIEMHATGYGPDGNGRWGALTASGLRPGYGVVAVDPRFIPLGTRLYVEGYGYAVAGDTGGAIKGNRIDLGFDSNRAARAVGRRKVRVLVMD